MSKLSTASEQHKLWLQQANKVKTTISNTIATR